MKKFIVILILIINSTFIINNCTSQWVPTYGTSISDKYVYSLAILGNNLFAGVGEGGIYKSNNNGVDWNITGFSNNTVGNLAVIGNTLILAAQGTGGGIFLSTNYGLNWTASDLTYILIRSLFANGTNVYAGCQTDMYISTNSGLNWVSIKNNLPNWPEIYAINEIGPYLFAGSLFGIFRSSNNGTNWTSTSISSSVTSFTTIGINIFAGTESNGVYLSSDNGDTWNNLSNGLPNSPVWALCVDGTNIIAGTDSGAYRTTNNGGNWTSVNKGLINLRVSSFIKTETNVFAGCSRYPNKGGVYLTTNNGDVWTLPEVAKQAISNFALKGNNIFAVSGYDGNVCNGIFLSTNYGNNWVSVNNGLPNLDVRSIAANDSYVFAGTYGNGVYLSSNNGGNWATVNTGLSSLFIRSLAVNGTNIFAGTDSSGIFLSTNNGSNWSPINNGITIRPVYSIGINGNNIYAGTDSARLYLSTNNGGIWTLVNNGFVNTTKFNSFSFSANNAYAGTSTGIYRSTNNGGNWISINVRETFSIVTFGTDIVILTEYGIYLSTNNGVTWLEKNQGFPASWPRGMSLLIKDNYIFAGMGPLWQNPPYYMSVWRRELVELTYVKNISSVTPLSYSLYQNYPNPFNPTTKLKFDVPSLSSPHVPGGDLVQLKVYDISGREIQTLVNEKLQPGTYETSFDGSQLTSGVYFYRLLTKNYSETKRMVLIK